jgi:hypothetical protein
MREIQGSEARPTFPNFWMSLARGEMIVITRVGQIVPEAHPPRTRRDQYPDNRKPLLAASTACRIISITDDPEPPF